MTFRIALNVAFLAALLVPPSAAMLSPRFGDFVKNVVADRATMPTEVEKLRRSTPLWTGAIELFNTALYHVGHSTNPNTGVIGKDGWVFLGNLYNNSFDESYGRYVPSDEALADWVWVMRQQVAYARHRNIPILYVIAPSQGTIYADKLPDHASGYDTIPTAFDRILEVARSEGLPLLDVRPDLRNARAKADTYSPFNSHWTDYGALVAWQSIAARVSRDLDNADMAALGAPFKIVTDSSIGTNEFTSILGIKADNPWTRPIFTEEFPPFEVQLPDGSTKHLTGDTKTDILDLPRTTRNANAANPYSVLIYRDSQGTSLSPFLQASFAQTYQVEHHIRNGLTPFNFAGPIEEYDPDLILYVITERYLSYPLGDQGYWASATAFDAESHEASSWPARPGRGEIIFSGDPSLDTSQPIILPETFDQKERRVVRFSIHAEGNGQMYLGYQVNGQVVESWHSFMRGRNEIYLDLQPGIDSNTIWAVRDGEQSKMALIEISAKSLEH